MARQSKNSKKSKKVSNKEDNYFESFLNPETRHGIYVVLLWVVGLISFLSLFNLAGSFGTYWALGLTRLFGWGDFLIPFVFIALGYVLLRPSKFEIESINYWGISLGVLSLYAFLHWTQGIEGLISSISLGKGGGYVGLILSWPIIMLFGQVASFVILLALILISFLVTFNTSIHKVIGEENILKRAYFSVRNSILSIKYNGNAVANETEEYEDEYEEGEEQEADEDTEDEEENLEDDEDIDNEGGEEAEPEQRELISVPKRKMPKIELPLELLTGKNTRANSGDIKQNQDIIERTLANFGISVEMGEVSVGPTVTQYTLRPAEGVKVSKIHSLQNDIALALAAHPIRIEAPIPGKSLVGIEVPNQSVATVTLKEVLSSKAFQKDRPSNRSLPLGQDVAGNTYVADLDKMPHLLVAGATGSGKSISINAMLLSLMYQNQPDDLKFILVDPKRVELTLYADIPFLLTPVITEVKKTINALRWAVGEMDRRYTLLSHSGHRKLATYNSIVSPDKKLPHIIIVIDELADLMSVAAADVESIIVRLAQMARAIGIHLILATQRPSVDVITGLIKANIPARIAFSVASIVDSRTILDASGAEKLLGSGDMLYTSAQVSTPKRLQGAFVPDKDIEAVTNFLRSKAKPDYTGEVTQTNSSSGGLEGASDEGDALLEEAKEVVLRAGKASASLLQRRLRVGYARAARILDILEESGFIGPADGAKPREILFTEDDLYNDSEQEEGSAVDDRDDSYEADEEDDLDDNDDNSDDYYESDDDEEDDDESEDDYEEDESEFENEDDEEGNRKQ